MLKGAAVLRFDLNVRVKVEDVLFEVVLEEVPLSTNAAFVRIVGLELLELVHLGMNTLYVAFEPALGHELSITELTARVFVILLCFPFVDHLFHIVSEAYLWIKLVLLDIG